MGDAMAPSAGGGGAAVRVKAPALLRSGASDEPCAQMAGIGRPQGRLRSDTNEPFRISRETLFVHITSVSLARCRWPVRPFSRENTIARSNSLLACNPVTNTQ